MLAAAGALRRFALVFAVVLELASALQAQDNAELLQRMSAMEQRIKALEAEIQTLKGQQPAPVPVAPPAAATPPAAPLAGQTPVALPNYAGAAAAASKIFNPDISVIGDFLGAAGYGAKRATPSLHTRAPTCSSASASTA